MNNHSVRHREESYDDRRPMFVDHYNIKQINLLIQIDRSMLHKKSVAS